MDEKEVYSTRENIFYVLEKGKKDDYYWYIISYGTHPCAYVAVNKEHPAYRKDYDQLYDISVHGGITYADHNDNNIRSIFDIDVWWFGWDYAHLGDYYCLKYNFDDFNKYNETRKKWTISEMKEDVLDVIEQLKGMLKEYEEDKLPEVR